MEVVVLHIFQPHLPPFHLFSIHHHPISSSEHSFINTSTSSSSSSSSSSVCFVRSISSLMEANKVVKEKVKKEGSEEVDEDDHLGYSEDDKKKKAGGGGSGRKAAAVMRCCQAEKCTADLTEAKQYHRRHKVCEHHAKAQVVVVGGIRQRFCQQCSRFHEVSEFDEAKRSCRRRLAGHNERRRKNSSDHAEGSGRKATHLKENVCGQVDHDHHRARIQISIQDNATNYKHFQI